MGKQRAELSPYEPDTKATSAHGVHSSRETGVQIESHEHASSTVSGSADAHPVTGRHVTVVFSNESEMAGGNLELWIESGESVGSVKDQIRHLRPSLAPLSLRLIHAGRLLTNGILLVPWLRSLEERVKRQAGGVGRDVEKVLKEVGLQDDDNDENRDNRNGATEKNKVGSSGHPLSSPHGAVAAAKSKSKARDKEDRVWLHCNVGGRLDEDKAKDKEEGEEVSIVIEDKRHLLMGGFAADSST